MAYNALQLVEDAYYGDLADAPLPKLHTVDGFTTSFDGQVIEDTNIYAYNNPLILNHRVIFRNSQVLYSGGPAVVMNDTAASSSLFGLSLVHQAIPSTIISLPEDDVAILINGAPGISLERIRIRGGAAGIVALGVVGLSLRTIQGRNFYGDTERGSFIRIEQGANVRLEDFYCLNALNGSKPEDVVVIQECDGAFVSNGFLDGNNSPTGHGVLVMDSSYVQVERVDVAHMGNGSIGVSGGFNNQFRKVNVRDTHTTSQGGRGIPSNPGRAFFSIAGTLDVQSTQFERATYFNLADSDPAVILDGEDTCDIVDIVSRDVSPRVPVAIVFPWEDNQYEAPYLLTLNGPTGVDAPYITNSINNVNTTIGKLYAESNVVGDTFTYAIISDPYNKFTLAGDLVKLSSKVNYLQSQTYPLTISVMGANGVATQRDFIVAVDADTGVSLTLKTFGVETLSSGIPVLDQTDDPLQASLIHIDDVETPTLIIDPVIIEQQQTILIDDLILPKPVLELQETADVLDTGIPTISAVTIVQVVHVEPGELMFGAYYLPQPIVQLPLLVPPSIAAVEIDPVTIIQLHALVATELEFDPPDVDEGEDLDADTPGLSKITTGAVTISPVNIVQTYATIVPAALVFPPWQIPKL